MPTDLSDKGQKIYTVINQALMQYGRNFTDCKAFYSPVEWARNNSYYGSNCHLVITYHYGDLKEIFHTETVFTGVKHIRQYIMQQLAGNGFYAVEMSETCTAIFSLHTFSANKDLS